MSATETKALRFRQPSRNGKLEDRIIVYTPEYDPDTKKTKQIYHGSIPTARALFDRGNAATVAERCAGHLIEGDPNGKRTPINPLQWQEVVDYIEARRAEVEKRLNGSALRDLPRTLDQALAALEAGEPVGQDKADEIREKTAKLKRKLGKVAPPRKTEKKASTSEPDPKQTSLTDSFWGDQQ